MLVPLHILCFKKQTNILMSMGTIKENMLKKFLSMLVFLLDQHCDNVDVQILVLLSELQPTHPSGLTPAINNKMNYPD